MSLCVYNIVYKLVYVLVSELVFQLVYKVVYVDQIVEHFVDQSTEEYVDQFSGHLKGQLLRRCQTTDAAIKSCVEIDDIARARIHGSHSQGCLHSCAEWCINA